MWIPVSIHLNLTHMSEKTIVNNRAESSLRKKVIYLKLLMTNALINQRCTCWCQHARWLEVDAPQKETLTHGFVENNSKHKSKHGPNWRFHCKKLAYTNLLADGILWDGGTSRKFVHNKQQINTEHCLDLLPRKSSQ